jgi:signal transduction histidine kinase
VNLQRVPKIVAARSGSRSNKEPARLRDVRLLLARAVWVAIAALALVRFAVVVPSYYAQLSEPAKAVRAGLMQLSISPGHYAAFRVALAVVVVLVYYAVALAIFWRKSDYRVALFVSLFLATFGVNASFLLTDLAGANPTWGWLFRIPEYVGWLCLSLFFYLFPDGRFTPRWTRSLAVLIAVVQVPLTFIPDSLLSQEAWWDLLIQVLFLGIWGSGVFAQVYRYRHVSGTVQRQQTKWVVFGTVATVFGIVGFVLPGLVSPSLTNLGSPYALKLAAFGSVPLLFMPLSIGIAVLRYGLWDIDAIINRTLVYGALSTGVVGIYILIVGYLGAVFRTDDNIAISVVAASLVAVIFQPLRERLQRSVNLLMYGERYEPYAVLSSLGRRLEGTLAPEAVLPAIVDNVARALRLPHVAIWLADGETLHMGAAHGGAPPESAVRDTGAVEVLRSAPEGLQAADLVALGEFGTVLARSSVALVVPLMHRGELVGALSLAPRSPGEGFSRADRLLLRDLATQAGTAAHAVRLTVALRSSLEDLRQSRERLVATQEEERRRIQRDLHDGLGPILASMRLRLEACLNATQETGDPLAGDLERLYELVGQATGDIRHLVHDLRPPVLDQLGLVSAIRQHCESFSRESGVEVSFEVEKDISASAAAEVTLLRIAQEALLNIERHARAARADVRLGRRDGVLRLEIRDDGVGFEANARYEQEGTGIGSMRERAESLGGTLRVTGNPSAGTEVEARLPLQEVAG